MSRYIILCGGNNPPSWSSSSSSDAVSEISDPDPEILNSDSVSETGVALLCGGGSGVGSEARLVELRVTRSVCGVRVVGAGAGGGGGGSAIEAKVWWVGWDVLGGWAGGRGLNAIEMCVVRWGHLTTMLYVREWLRAASRMATGDVYI